ncbi:hypothetical protein BURMUCGD2M_3661 [Burkholderia multivorans CGD2M]|uniref:Uncharacterized protein n=1 Tax=Burkholderia multivorans CGD2 TaxID=513052 RepID=B9BUD3_9BURK|nr:hypothetical protein BURMUCGD2_3673 [Burkholderia multivorans CGD2]EEE11702.1 hypothetical protein BURMUCGD2M_3661 [Burkholderia multivorans CGD2M]
MTHRIPTVFFFADRGDLRAFIRPFRRPAAWRGAIRPRRTSAIPQGNPGIFSHFLRNYG